MVTVFRVWVIVLAVLIAKVIVVSVVAEVIIIAVLIAKVSVTAEGTLVAVDTSLAIVVKAV